MNKNYKKSFSKKRIDKKELLLYALNILNFDLIRSEKELLKGTREEQGQKILGILKDDTFQYLHEQ